jgi:hypothetical protein
MVWTSKVADVNIVWSSTLELVHSKATMLVTYGMLARIRCSERAKV